MANRAPIEGPATTDPIESEDADQGGEHVCDIVKTGNPETVSRRDTGNGEDGGPVNGDTGDADPLLEYLQPHDQLDAATSVELARVPAEEHGQVAVLGRRLPLQLDDVANVLELGFRRTVTFAAEATEDEPGFFLAPDLDEPAGGFGHRPHDEEETDEGHDLERDREAPNEG